MDAPTEYEDLAACALMEAEIARQGLLSAYVAALYRASGGAPATPEHRRAAALAVVGADGKSDPAP